MAALYVFLGGGLGSLCRYGINLWISSHNYRLPVATITANVLAGLILGFIAAWAMKNDQYGHIWMLAAVGFCGGFSTFSTFSLENVYLWQNGHYGAMLLNVGLSVVLCFGSVLLGMRIANLWV